MERYRLTDWMMLPLNLYSIVFYGLKEGTLNMFLLFQLREKEIKAKKKHLPKIKWRIKERERERERDS